MRKKLLSILLTLALLLSLIPAGYAADIEIVDEPVGADAPGGSLDEIVIDPVGADALGGPLDIPDVPLTVGDVVASGECGENLTWTLDGNTLTISGTGDMWDYNWNTTPWYGYRSSIMTLVIEEGVTSISKFAFLYCGSLTNVMLPESMISIGWRAFESCTALTRVTIPAGVTNIEDSVFMSCSSMEAIIVDEGNQYYQSLDGVLLTKDGSALICCPARKTGEYEVPAGVETIENWAFDECSGLTAITLPDSLRHINWGAFSGCTGISEITLPEGLLSVDSDSFANMNLHEITFPASLQEFRSGSGDAVFANTPIENIYVAEDNPTFCSVDGVMFSKDQSELVMFPTGRTGSYTVPEGVTSLGEKSMDGVCLTEVILPDSLTEIGPNAFQFARNLTSLTIPSGVTSIGTWAFACCVLTEIRFEGSAPTFGEGVFTDLTATAYYPENDPSWTEDVRQNYGGTITWVPYTDGPETVASGQCGENLFWTLDEAGTLTITGTGNMWDSTGAQGYGGAWSAYGAQIRTVIIEDGATSIGAESFKNCDQITSVVIPDSLLTIDNQAFLNCSALESLSLGEGLIGIGYESFSGCSSLQSVRLPDSVTGLSLGVFGSCSSLRSVAIGSGLRSFYSSTFVFCNKLTELTVSEDNPYYCSIDNVIFSKDGTELVCCPNGRAGEYRIPEGTAVVREDAFSFCGTLTGVEVPDSVTEIGNSAFRECVGLTGIRFEGNAPAFGERCFENVTATAYYPAFDLSWTEDVRQDYGGTITWVAETGDGLPVDEEHFPDEAFRAYVAENFDWDNSGLLNDEEIAAITEIDVSMMGIASLHGIEFFPELTVLFCLDNELTELDLSHNPKLEMLDCSFNSLTALDVTHNPALTSIDCSENAITDLDTSANPLLEGLFCYGNEIFMLRLYGNPALQVLDCSTNRLTALDLSGNPGLVMLECYGNSIAELDFTPCPTLVDVVTNGTYEQKTNYDSYTASTGNFVHVDPTTKLRTETFTVTLTDYTKGTAQTSIDFTAKYSGELSFTVSADSAVAVAVKKGDEYTLLRCSTWSDEYWFALNVTEDTELVFAFRGDVNLDGAVKSSEVTMIKRAIAGTYQFKNGMAELAADVSGDGTIKSSDATMLARSIAGTYTIKW